MFFEMEYIVVSLAEKANQYYDGVIDEYGRARRILLATAAFPYRATVDCAKCGLDCHRAS